MPAWRRVGEEGETAFHPATGSSEWQRVDGIRWWGNTIFLFCVEVLSTLEEAGNFVLFWKLSLNMSKLK